MDEEELRLTLLWLIERDDYSVGVGLPIPTGPHCSVCGHELSNHMIAGDADNPSPWPCTYPKTMGAPFALCRCADYIPMNED